MSEISGAITIDLALNGCWNQPEGYPVALSACSLRFILNRECLNDFSPQRILSQQTSLLKLELLESGRILVFDLSQDGVPLVHMCDEAIMLAADPESSVLLSGVEPKTIARNPAADLFLKKKKFVERFDGRIVRFDFK